MKLDFYKLPIDGSRQSGPRRISALGLSVGLLVQAQAVQAQVIPVQTVPPATALPPTVSPTLQMPAARPALPAPNTMSRTTTPAQLPSTPAIGVGDDYVLGAGDRLRADIFNVQEFGGEYPILPNGTINMPRIGSVMVQGLTLKQASETISYRYRNYLTRPIVTLSLIAGRPVNVAIAGEVNRPGSYTMNSAAVSATGEMPTLTKLLQIADGVTQAADLGRVQIRRRSQAGNQTYAVNLWELVKNAESSQDIRLQDGDSIYIPESTNISLANARQLTSVNFATRSNRPLKIAVVGEVNRPGPYTIFEGNATQSAQRNETANVTTPSVTQALQIAGGITQMADLRNVKVRRLTRSGNEQLISVNFWELIQSGDVLQDLPLQDGDRIEIARANSLNDQETTFIARTSVSPDRITVNVVGEVKGPGAVALTPNTPLNQAILSAGGFNDRAKKGTVTLVRLEPNGSVSKRDIAVNFGEGVSSQNNPALRNGDTVIVGKSGLAGIGDAFSIITNPVSGALGLLRLLGIFR